MCSEISKEQALAICSEFGLKENKRLLLKIAEALDLAFSEGMQSQKCGEMLKNFGISVSDKLMA